MYLLDWLINILSYLILLLCLNALRIYYALFRFLSSTPSSISDIKELGKEITLVVSTVIKAWLRQMPPSSAPHEHHHHHQDKAFSCQLAITEFTGEYNFLIISCL